jgi:hypothetical protein
MACKHWQEGPTDAPPAAFSSDGLWGSHGAAWGWHGVSMGPHGAAWGWHGAAWRMGLAWGRHGPHGAWAWGRMGMDLDLDSRTPEA